jgi:pyruvate-ferredoxin/flavodoxin oxidoreductase
MKVVDTSHLKNAPENFLSTEAKGLKFKGRSFTLQVGVEDCTGCGICFEVCPVKKKEGDHTIKALEMKALQEVREEGRIFWDYFLKLPETDPDLLKVENVRGSQLLQPLFEYSGACMGCGETPYIKLLTQLFGERMYIANATGCSSIYGGNLPTTPYCQNEKGRGPVWSNSLFEDNAEFGYGFRLTLDFQKNTAEKLLRKAAEENLVDRELVRNLLENKQESRSEILQQRQWLEVLKQALQDNKNRPLVEELLSLADALLKKSVWIVGGDGWAYDIGFGGLDHVLASGANINVLVMDTETYSNTGGQASKATPPGAVAKFAASGKSLPKKDLGKMMMNYGYVYVASVAMGADSKQLHKAVIEAEEYNGPSLILAYSTCIAHGINMRTSMDFQKLAVQSGHWPLYRYDPRRREKGLWPFQLDSKAPSVTYADFTQAQNRFQILKRNHPEHAAHLQVIGQNEINARWATYQQMTQGALPTRHD